jgi:hypothetical protein
MRVSGCVSYHFRYGQFATHFEPCYVRIVALQVGAHAMVASDSIVRALHGVPGYVCRVCECSGVHALHWGLDLGRATDKLLAMLL